MGKKSKAKKVKKAAAKAAPAKEDLKKVKKIFYSKRKIKGALLFLAGLILLGIVGTLIYFKLEPTPLAKMLPQDKTIGFIEVDIGDQQVINAQNLLEKHEIYGPERIKSLVYDVTGVSFDDAAFIGEKIGLGFMQLDESGAIPLVFLSVKDHGDAIRFLRNLAIKEKGDAFTCEKVEGYELCGYKLSYNVALTFYKDYLVLSPSKQVLLEMRKNDDKVSRNRKFIQIRDNLPARNLAFIYVDAQTALKSLFENKSFVEKKGYELSALAPLLQIFKSHGTVLIAQENNLAMQTYTYMDKDKLSEESFISFSRKYASKLSKYVDKTPVAFFGGHNITKQLQRVSKLISTDTRTAEILLDGVLKAQVKKYFGDEVGLEEDIYPIIENEYAFVADPDYKVILELNGTEREKVEKLLDNFVEVNAVFAPKVIETELEDGTISKEIVASEEEVEEIKEVYKGVDTTSLKLGEKSWGIYYAFLSDVAIFASSKESLQKSIDLYKDPQESLQESAAFKALFAPIIRNNDEISFINFSFLLDKLNVEGEYRKYFDPISTVVSGKNYFDDGISTTHYILVK
ncbi:MAG: DUF3352 domain-containing protein [Patescibacteria group bacterium]|nr:DUF3352 domain-containing protein [Patescibacteria group bacterium]